MRESGEFKAFLGSIEGKTAGNPPGAGQEMRYRMKTAWDRVEIARRTRGWVINVTGPQGERPQTQKHSQPTGKSGPTGGFMLTSLLLEKLLQIERLLGHVEPTTLRALLMDAEAEALRVQSEMIQVMQDMERLREQYERCARSALSPVSARHEQRLSFSPEALARGIAVAPPYAHQAE